MDRIADIWGARLPYGPDEPWPVRVDQTLAPGITAEQVDRWVPSACVLCSYGCGVELAVKDGRLVGIRGRADDHLNHGRLGPKGSYGWQANASQDRLTRPLIRRGGELEPTDWETAMGTIAERARQLLAERGPSAFGFYTSGQLFLEEYYTLAVLVRGGIGTPHLDGNTRLCTATADAALKESFGADGDPGCIEDIDLCDTLFLVGHNVAETQTVFWMRILDRLHGSSPPALIVVDPRRTPTAAEADVHLPIRSGTNVPLLNAIQHELIRSRAIDTRFVDDHTVGFDDLAAAVDPWSPERAAELCDVPADDIRRAAETIARAQRLVSTVLQGVYQSHQATAAAVQVDNIHLLRGMIGKPGATVFQMNGQPTAQNTRETGANGDFPGVRNWANPDHVAELAAAWHVDPITIPHWGPPTHVMQIMRYAEEGSIRLLWVSGTNPAVSLPELHRVRSILSQERLFLVVQDAFPTETTALADVVLPAAMWAEKTGTFTNFDRTVHLSEKAIEPPGEARPDLEIFVDLASRLDLRNADGGPLIGWREPEEAFDAFRAITVGRPADYSGITYAMLRDRGYVQWPCNDDAPTGTQRLYVDAVFPTDTAVTEDYGHDLLTGAANEESDHRALGANGRAFLKPAEWAEPVESPRDEYPLRLTTGRRVYHWHTRTKTARAPELQAAAPDVWVELHDDDATALGIGEGDRCRVISPRGEILAPARLGGPRPGHVFVPFHYGYWDRGSGGPERDGRAANELTITAWDPVSRQPLLKNAAVRVEKAP